MTTDDLWKRCEEGDWRHWAAVERLIRALRLNQRDEDAERAIAEYTERYGPPTTDLSRQVKGAPDYS